MIQRGQDLSLPNYEMKGVPIRIGLGKRDIENGVVEVARRDTKAKNSVARKGIAEYVVHLLDVIQSNLLARAKKFRSDNTHYVDNMDQFKDAVAKGGFIMAHWDGTSETEKKIKELTNATIRCIPNDFVEEVGVCVLSGAPSKGRVVFAKAY